MAAPQVSFHTQAVNREEMSFVRGRRVAAGTATASTMDASSLIMPPPSTPLSPPATMRTRPLLPRSRSGPLAFGPPGPGGRAAGRVRLGYSPSSPLVVDLEEEQSEDDVDDLDLLSGEAVVERGSSQGAAAAVAAAAAAAARVAEETGVSEGNGSSTRDHSNASSPLGDAAPAREDEGNEGEEREEREEEGASSSPSSTPAADGPVPSSYSTAAVARSSGSFSSMSSSSTSEDVDMPLFSEGGGLVTMTMDDDEGIYSAPSSSSSSGNLSTSAAAAAAAAAVPAVPAANVVSLNTDNFSLRRSTSGGSVEAASRDEHQEMRALLRRGSVGGASSNGVGVAAAPRRRGASLGSSGGSVGSSSAGAGAAGMRSGLSRKFVRSLLRHLNMRADSRQREELRSMVETLKHRSSVRGVDMKQELKREAVSLLGPELAREAFEASLSETRSEFHRQRAAAAAAAAAAAEARRAGGGAAAAAAAGAAAAAVSRRESSSFSPPSGLPPMQSSSSSSSLSSMSGRNSGRRSTVGIGRVGGGASMARGESQPPPRKRRSFGAGRDSRDSSLDSDDGEEPPEAGAGAGAGVRGGSGSGLPFFAMPAEDVEQRLKAIHGGPAHEGFHLCCVCMDRPRDAALIHGKTSHQACCYDCALELFERGLPCPCCRQSIAHVVKNFV